MSVASILAGTPAALASIYGGGGGGGLPTQTGSGVGNGSPQKIVQYTSADAGLYAITVQDSTNVDSFYAGMYCVTNGGIGYEIAANSLNISTTLPSSAIQVNVPNGDAYTWTIVRLI